MLVSMINRRTGELLEVDGDDSASARSTRHRLYLRGWERRSRRRCLLTVDMLGCNCVQTVKGQRIIGKRHGPNETHFLHRRLDALSDADDVQGHTLPEINMKVAQEYMREAVRAGACVGKADCIHVKKSKPIHMDTMDYLCQLGYVEVYQDVPGRGWIGALIKKTKPPVSS